MKFIDLKRLTWEYIAKKILDFYTKAEINPKKCRAQWYEGTPNMK